MPGRLLLDGRGDHLGVYCLRWVRVWDLLGGIVVIERREQCRLHNLHHIDKLRAVRRGQVQYGIGSDDPVHVALPGRIVVSWWGVCCDVHCLRRQHVRTVRRRQVQHGHVCNGPVHFGLSGWNVVCGRGVCCDVHDLRRQHVRRLRCRQVQHYHITDGPMHQQLPNSLLVYWRRIRCSVHNVQRRRWIHVRAVRRGILHRHQD